MQEINEVSWDKGIPGHPTSLERWLVRASNGTQNMILKAIVERGIICQLLLVAAVGQMLCLAVNIVIKHNLKYLEKI